MTLGQRIQEERKKRNLSQEALGEAMGVSRQAISKWESDLTIPELDKLIALSKLFELPVGQLLGVEEPAVGEERAEEDADRTLDMAKAIAEGYLAQERADQKRREKRLWIAACAAALALAVGLTGTLTALGIRFDRLEDRMNGVEDQVSQISGNVNSEINAITRRLQEAIAGQAALVERWDYTVDRVDGSGIQMTVTVVPKEYVQGTTAMLTLRPDEGDPVAAQGEWDGQAFRFPVKLREVQDFGVTLSMEAEGVQRTQELEGIYDLRYLTRLSVQVKYTRDRRSWDALDQTWNGIVKPQWTIEMIQEEGVADLYPETLVLRWMKNGQVIERQEVPLQKSVMGHSYTASFLWKKEISLEREGDEYVLDYWMRDNVGQTYQGEEFFRFTVEQGNKGLYTLDQPRSTPPS